MKKREIVLLLALFLAMLFISLISSASFNQDYSVTKGYSVDNPLIVSGNESGNILKYLNISEGSEYFNIEKGDKQKRVDSSDISQIQELTASMESLPDYNFKDENSYIIEFKKPSVLEKRKDLNEEIEKIKKETQISGKDKGMFSIQSSESKLKQKEEENKRVLSNHKNELKSEHDYALNDINSILKQGELSSLSPLNGIIDFLKNVFILINKDTVIGKIYRLAGFRITGFVISDVDELKPKKEYFNTFNGIALDISKEDAEKLKGSEYVKNVYLDLRVEANLMDSVPLINADDVWQLDEDGNNCTQTGKSCLTGKNITIAIIDTGIDYTHLDLGGSLTDDGRVYERITIQPIIPYFPITPWVYDRQIFMKNNKLLYYSGNKLYLYSFITREAMEINIASGFTDIVTLAFKDNIIAYFASTPDLNTSLFYYDLTAQTNVKITQDYTDVDVGSLFVENDKIIYSLKYFQDNELFSRIYIYNITSGEKEIIGENSEYILLPRVSNEKIAYSNPFGGWYDKIILYDMNTKTLQELTPPDVGPLLDFEGDEILYVDANETNFDIQWRHYHLFDINSGESTALFYDTNLGETGVLSGRGVPGWINKGAIGERVIFFSKDVNANTIIAYDQDLDRYVEVNPAKVSGVIDAENTKVCFLGTDLNIYCHDYNSSYDYPSPESVFNNKVVGGYDFVNNDNDPMDDMGHGTHVAGIAAGKSQGNLIENYKYQEGNYVGIGEYFVYGREDTNDYLDIIKLVSMEKESDSVLLVSIQGINSNGENSFTMDISGDYAYSDSGEVYIKADIINRKVSFTWGSGADYDNPGNFVSDFDINISKPIGLNGVAPDAKLYAYKVLDAYGSGYWSDVIAGIERAVDPNKDGDFSDHADIMSLSLGSECGEYSSECGPDDAVSQAIDNAVSNGVIAIIAAGNSGPGFETIGSPGTARKAITVGASNKWDGLADFSSKGPVIWKDIQGNEKYLIKPDIVAPGYEICSAQYDSAWNDRKCFDNNHVAISGTSMATPHVAGAVALLKQAHPDWTPEQIKSQLQNTAKDIFESEDSSKKLFSYGYGRLDILNAVVKKTPVLDLEININKGLGIINLTYKADGDDLKNYSIIYKQIDSNAWKQLTSSTQLNNLQNIFQISELDNGELFFKLEVYDNNNNLFHKEIMTKIENIKPYISNKYNYLTEQFEKVYVNVSSGNYISYEIYLSNSSQETPIYSSSNPLQSGEIAEINTDSINDGEYNLIIRAEHESGKIIDSQPLKVIVFKSLRKGLTGFSELEAPRYFSVSDLEGDKKITFMSEEHEQLGGGWYRIYNNIEIWKTDNREKLINKNNKLWEDDISYEIFNPQGYGIYNTGQTQLIFDDAWKQGEGDDVTYGNRKGIIGKDLNYLYSWPSNIQNTRLHYGDYYSRVFDSKIYSLYEYDNWSLIDINYSAFWDSQVYKIKIHNKYGELINNLEFKQFEHIEDAPSGWGGMLPSPRLFFIGEDTSKLGVISTGKLDYYANGQEKNTNWMDLIIFDLETEQQIVSKSIPVDLDDFYSLNSVISGDVDNDNLTEIVISYSSLNQTLYNEDTYNLQVYHQNFLILDANGNEKYPKISFAGYVGYNEAIITEYNNKKYIVSSLSGTWATGSTDQLVVFDLQGNILTNITNGYDQIIYEAVSGDIDSDEITEIIYSTYPRFWADDNGINSHINIINITGSLEKDIEFYNSFIASQMALSDYNNNQQLDLSVIGESFDGFNSLGTTLYNFNLGSDYNESNLYWPIKWNNPQRTNCYESKGKELTSYLELNSLMQVNTISQINLKIENSYDSVKQVNYSVYSSPCNFEERETCLYELINSKNISVSGNSEYKEDIQFTPSNIGEYVLKLEVLEEGSLEPKADYYSTRALEFFSDWSIDYLSAYDFLIGRETEIGVYISNSGNIGSNADVSLYYEKGMCGYSCNNLTLIETKQATLGRGESKGVMFNWVPLETGDITLVAKVNVSDDINPDNNINYVTMFVKEQGPDLGIQFSWKNWDREFVVNETNNITLTINNYGTETATNINISLYEREFLPKEEGGEENNILISSVLVNSMDINEEKEIDISWKPSKISYIELMVNISSDKDVYEDNNKGYSSFFVAKNETDISVSDIYFSPSKPTINQEADVYVILSNLGRHAKNVNLSVYDNNIIIESMIIDEIYSGNSGYSFLWTPTIKGSRTIRAEAVLIGDVNNSDNVMEENISVYNKVNVTFKITDSQNNNVERYLFSEYTEDEDLGYINGEKTFVFPDLSETGERFEFGIAKLDGFEDGGVATLFNISLVSNINIISEFYNKTTENNTSYYTVFANLPSVSSSNNRFMIGLSQDYFLNLGIDMSSGDYDLFYCIKFNFMNKKCSEVWRKAKVDSFYIGGFSGFVSIEGHTTESAEAFAISKSIKFDGATTNLTDILLDKIRNLTIEKETYGKIIFKDEVNITRLKLDSKILEKYIEITPGRISVDTEVLTEFKNKSAELLFKNIDLHNPKVFYNGVECPSSVCKGIIYNTNEKIVLLNVTGFSEFSIVEGPYCGDGNKDTGETCSNCVADMGACPPDGGKGGNGGGGGGGSSCAPNWDCTWGPCTDKKESFICKDIKQCVIQNKISESRICFVESDCVDNDGDGYGVGADCLGRDLNDNDIGITDTLLINPEKNKGFNLLRLLSNHVKLASIIISIIIVIVFFIIIILFLLRRTIKTPIHKRENAIKILKARNFVKETRLRGIKDKKIKELFIEKGWKEKDIEEIMKD
jgi:subtilisin family serine protease